MGAVSSIFAMVQEPLAPSLPTQTDDTFSPQANATPTTGVAPQDIVTLAARAAEGQQTRAGNENGQFGETAAFFLAERQSFRAGTGSGGSKTAQTPSVPQLPVKIVEERAVGREAPGTQNQTNAANTTSASALAAEAGSTETQQTSSSPGATAGAGTPLAELAQLDDTLQQMGVNPQSISLFNRMAMVLYANDPAALRVLVQTLQSGAEQVSESNSVNTANGTNASEPQNASSSLASLPQQAADMAGENVRESQVEAADNEQSATDSASAGTLQVEAPATNEEANATTAGSAATTGANEPKQQAGPSQLSIQLERLNSAFAAVAAQQFPAPSGSTVGQLLNVRF